jgi:hypothetical protein
MQKAILIFVLSVLLSCSSAFADTSQFAHYGQSNGLSPSYPFQPLSITGSIDVDSTGQVQAVFITYDADTFSVLDGQYNQEGMVHVQILNTSGTKMLHLLAQSSGQ